MARLKVLSADEISDLDLRALMEESGDESFGIYGHCPDLFKPFFQLLRVIKYDGQR